MKKTLIYLLSLVSLMLVTQIFAEPVRAQLKKVTPKQANDNSKLPTLKDGDMIFQSSISPQCKAIQLATRSPYSHCGIIFYEQGKPYVLEAVQPVTVTKLEHWIARGEKQHYAIKRLKNADHVLTNSTLAKMKAIGKNFLGKNYDATFEWSDDKIYCSELIWKIYQRGAGIEVGKLEKLKDFDLSSPEVKAKLKERYGNSVPLNETVISPASIFNNPLLITIVNTY
ncbi:MAG: YiiX family permuted papain-like enzyme [Sphingobacterium sp.]